MASSAIDVLIGIEKLTEYMTVSTVVTQLFPLFVATFITFFGRFFDDLLRLICVFVVVMFPMAAEALTPWWNGQPLDLDVTDVTSLIWAIIAAGSASYAALNRPAFGIKIQLIGVAFCGVMVINSYYIGHIHQEVNTTMPGVARWFNWLNLALVTVASAFLFWARELPVAGDLVATCVCSSIGGFMMTQLLDGIFIDMRVDISEGLGWQKLVGEEFGCVRASCGIFLTVMIVITVLGAFNNHVMWKHHSATLIGQHSAMSFPLMTNLYHKIQDNMTVLFNLNEAISIYSQGLSEEEELKKELDIQRDVYNVMGLLTDIYIVIYALGLAVHISEMATAGIFSHSSTSWGFTVMLCLMAVIGFASCAFCIKTRLLKEQIGSLPWKQQTMVYIQFVAVTWPILLFGVVFTGTIGGQEVAQLDVPYMNQAAGFARLPLGCDTIRQTQQNEGSSAFCDWVGMKGQDGDKAVRVDQWGMRTTGDMVDTADNCAAAVARYKAGNPTVNANAATWRLSGSEKGECYAQIGLNGTTGGNVVANVDTWQTCMPSKKRFDSVQVLVEKSCRDGMINFGEAGIDCGGMCARQCGGCQCTQDGRSGRVLTPYKGCAPHLAALSNESSYNVYLCFVVEPSACKTTQKMDNFTTAYEKKGAAWKHCAPHKDRLTEWGKKSAPPPAPPPPVPTEVWYCEPDTARCRPCNTDRCMNQDCQSVAAVKTFFPKTFIILGKLTIAIFFSIVTVSGQLGGFYLFATRFTVYITSLNLIQGLAVTIFGAILEWKAGIGVDEAQATVDGLIEGEVSFFRAIVVTGIFLVIQSAVGLYGVRHEDQVVGYNLLRCFQYSVFLTFMSFLGLFAAAVYYVMNIESNIDRHWDSYIYPHLSSTNGTAVDALDGVSRISKDQFVEYAKGAFRMILLIGLWFCGYALLLFIITRYTITQRMSAAAEYARSQKKGTSNPMFGTPDGADNLEELTPRDESMSAPED